MSDIEEDVDYIFEQYEGEEIETLDDLDIHKVMGWCKPSSKYSSEITNKKLHEILSSNDFATFLSEVIGKERKNAKIIVFSLFMLEFLFKHKLFPKDMINTLICNPGHSSSGEASSSTSLPSSGKILTACIELIELNLPEITLNATKCIIFMSQLFPSHEADPVITNVLVSNNFRVFIDQFLILLNAGEDKISSEYSSSEYSSYSDLLQSKLDKNEVTLATSFLLHVTSMPELCRGICFGNNLNMFVDIIIRRIDQTDTSTSEGFTLLMGLDALLRNSEYCYLSPPRHKQEEMKSLMKELSGGDYTEDVHLLVQTIISSYPIFTEDEKPKKTKKT